jgi:putative ABC transport system permease protein
MKIRTIARYALKEVVRRRGRTIACALGYALAAAAIISTMGIVRHYAEITVNVLKGVGTHFGAYIPVPAEEQSVFKNGGPSMEGVYSYLFDADFVSEIKRLPGVRDAAPYFVFSKIERGIPVVLGGLDPGNIATWNNVCAPAQIIKGRFLAPTDSNGIMLEEAYEKVVKKGISDTLSLFEKNFQIIGIVNSGIRPGKANAYALLHKVQEIVHADTTCRCLNRKGCAAKPNDINIVLVEVADSRNQNTVLNLVQKALGSATISSYNCYQPASKVIGTIVSMTVILSIFVGLFAMAFAAGSQLQSLSARAKDIGLLRALGWPITSITLLFVVESCAQAIAGVTCGCLGGILIVFMRFGTLDAVPWTDSIAVFILMCLSGIFAGMAAAWQARKLNPAELLRRL